MTSIFLFSVATALFVMKISIYLFLTTLFSSGGRTGGDECFVAGLGRRIFYEQNYILYVADFTAYSICVPLYFQNFNIHLFI